MGKVFSGPCVNRTWVHGSEGGDCSIASIVQVDEVVLDTVHLRHSGDDFQKHRDLKTPDVDVVSGDARSILPVLL